MTHDTRFTLRFQNHRSFLRAAVVYDFIPLEWPGYLPTVRHRVDYLAKMARLKKFDRFFPISEYSAWRLSELLGVPRDCMHVTGAPVRRSLYEIFDRTNAAPSFKDRGRYFLTLAAGDIRKNAGVVVKAVRGLNLIHQQAIGLKVVGHSYSEIKGELLKLAGHQEGRGFLEFCPNVPDEELVELYRGAIATVVPSHIEGFSLPVVEASVCHCPTIVSTCAAHLELVDQAEALFPSDDADSLTAKLEAVLHQAGLRDELIQSQSRLAGLFHEGAVGERFWKGIEGWIGERQRAPGVGLHKKPRIAFLSPFPPDQSGVARYTALTINAGTKYFESTLFSDAPRPLAAGGQFFDGGRVSLAPIIQGNFNGVISVLGDSRFHASVFDVFERYGGPCILHDARLIQSYLDRLGPQRLLELATRYLNRSLTLRDLHHWLLTETPDSLLLEPVVERASPLIVHTRTQQAEIKRRYGTDTQVIPPCPTAFFSKEELTDAAREQARARLGVGPETFLIASFGNIAPERGMHTCIFATELLRSWKIPAELYFVGNPNIYKAEVERLTNLYGIAAYVHKPDQYVDESVYRDFLIASDAGVQLRTFGFGQFSAALTDCISAGLPSVASEELALSCEAPSYISVVPNHLSPLLVAEQLAVIWDSRGDRSRQIESRNTYLENHNFDTYARRLVEVLGLA